MTAGPDYEVGYGRPPIKTRFQAGVSGNPRGRPKGSLGIPTMLLAALNERVTINENGKRQSITKMHAGAKQMANKTASGDLKAVKLVVDILQQFEAREAARDSGQGLSTAELNARDNEALKAIRDAFRTLKIDDADQTETDHAD